MNRRNNNPIKNNTMSKTIKVIKEIELPAPPETHYFIPHREEGITIRKGDLLFSEGDDGWEAAGLCGVKLSPSHYLARLRPYNPQGLSDEILAQLPDKARFLSKEEYDKLKRLGGLKKRDRSLLYWYYDEWRGDRIGDANSYTYATYHLEGYYLTLDESAFRKGKQKPEAPTPPEGFKLETDPNYICQEGDMVWCAKISEKSKWYAASGMIGRTAEDRFPYIATPIKKKEKLVPWTFETRPVEAHWFREKGEAWDALMAIRWMSHTVVFCDGAQPTYEALLEHYEWSANGKDNWQPCGTEVEA